MCIYIYIYIWIMDMRGSGKEKKFFLERESCRERVLRSQSYISPAMDEGGGGGGGGGRRRRPWF